MTPINPNKVRVSFAKFKITVLIKVDIIPISKLKCEINFPECFLSIISVSPFITDFISCNCKIFVTSSATRINIVFA